MTVIRRFFVTAAISASAFAIATPAQAADPAMSYVVQPGDYLLRIASDHSVALKALLQENDLTSERVILPGQRLTIPAGGTAPVAPTTAAPAPAAPAKFRKPPPKGGKKPPPSKSESFDQKGFESKGFGVWQG